VSEVHRPKVTIAIPCHNAAQWVGQAVESALNQRGVTPEVVVVDDGSTDASVDILQSFGDRITLITGPNHGGNRARNTAWRNGSGEWVQFLDADDYLEPDKVARQLTESADGAGADVLYSPVWIETVTGGTTSREKSDTKPGDDIFAQWIAWRLPQTGSALWRRTVLETLGGWEPEQPCCQEHELYLRALMNGCRFVYAPTPGAVYRIWSEQTLCRKDPRKVIRGRTGLIDRLRSWLTENGKWSAAHEAEAARACFEMARTWAKHDAREAVRYANERQKLGMFRPSGPAAPISYRLAYRLLGFAGAETVATWAR
jgi:hypothetical protein